MKKIISLFLTVVLMSALLTGCSSAPSSPEASSGQENSNDAAPDTGAQEGSQKDLGEITVYSPAPAEPLNGGVEAFQKATGIKVNVVAAGTGELLKRIESESAAPLCDVVWGGGAESMQAYAEYFEPYVPTEDSAIPESVKDKNDYWVGESPVPVVIMYNEDLLNELGVEIPTSWEDLLDPRLKGMIAFADPAKSGSAFTLLCTMISAAGGPENGGWEFIEQLYANLDGKIQDSSSNSYKLVADGEYAIGLTQEKSVQEYLDAGADNIGYVYPSEGTSAVPDAIAIVKNCPNPEGAKAFVEYILSVEAQQMQAEEFNRRPARGDVAAPGSLCDLSEIPLVDYDFEWAGNNKAEILEKWQEIIVG